MWSLLLAPAGVHAALCASTCLNCQAVGVDLSDPVHHVGASAGAGAEGWATALAADSSSAARLQPPALRKVVEVTGVSPWALHLLRPDEL